MRDDRARLQHMVDAVDNIEKYAVHGRYQFMNDELVRTYIVHHLQILGEAGTKLTTDLKDRHPEIPWPKVLGIRHIIVHDYFQVDYEIVWDVVVNELATLKTQLKEIIDTLDGPHREFSETRRPIYFSMAGIRSDGG